MVYTTCCRRRNCGSRRAARSHIPEGRPGEKEGTGESAGVIGPRDKGLTVLPKHKTKIVATIGPATESAEMLNRLIRAGLNVARLNFSHGDFTSHAERIKRIRLAAQAVGRRVAIMADLPGPKIRVGEIEPEPIQLHPGGNFTLTTEDIAGTPQRVSVSFKDLPRVVQTGSKLFLNDGLVQLT